MSRPTLVIRPEHRPDPDAAPPVGRRRGAAAARLLTLVARAAVTGVVLYAVASVLVFALVRSAPGDPVDLEFGAAGVSVVLTPAEEAAARTARRAELGLDADPVTQYLRWVARAVTLDLGRSYRTGRPVAVELAERLPASAALGGAGFLIALVASVGAAVAAARRPDGLLDQLLRVASLAVAAVPTFLLGSLALRAAADRLGYPVAGAASLERLWLPALVLGVASIPTLARVLRAALLSEHHQPYAAAARARGAGYAGLTARHVLRPALTPQLTMAGLTLAALVTGTVITEAVFSWPGVSAYALTAIAAQDHPVAQAYLLLVVAVVVAVNRAVDVVQRLLDPRTAT